MIYPIRLLRLRQDIERAKIRLAAQFKFVKLQRINQHTYPKQPEKPAIGHVSFSGNTKVVQFDRTQISALALIRKPSTIDKLSKEVLLSEALCKGISTIGKSIIAIQEAIRSMWISTIRHDLQIIGIITKSIKDSEIEEFYNLVIGLKRATNLILAGVETVPRMMNISSLHSFMNDHSLTIPTNSSHLACIRSIESYLFDHIPSVETPVSDLARRRFSAIDIFNLKYCMNTLPMLQDELKERGVHPPKSIVMCKNLLVDIIQQELTLSFTNALEHCVEMSLIMMHQSSKGKNVSEKLLRLFSVLKAKNELIPEDFE